MNYPLTDWQLVWSGRKERRKDGLAVLFLALFPLSTVASDSSFQSHKTGGGTVVAVTKGLAFSVRISAPHVRCLQIGLDCQNLFEGWW